MRKIFITALVTLSLGAVAHAASSSGTPDLPIHFVNAIPDICFQTARGHPPTVENAASLLLEPAANVPMSVKSHFYKVTTWFALRSEPGSIFVGIGDRANCHLVLANSALTRDVQAKVIALLKSGGFQTLSTSLPGALTTDTLFAKEAPDGYMLISLQAPHDAVRGGEGDQGAVHVNLMPKAMFEALLTRR